LREVPEEMSNEFYNLLIKRMRKHKYDHYEISNFALTGYRSRHNSAYWMTYPYIGFGPSAHSYNGYYGRRQNVRSVQDYINFVLNDMPHFEYEYVNLYNRYNEFIINGLRTKEGVNIELFIKKEDALEAEPFITNYEIHHLYKHYKRALEQLKKDSFKAFRSFEPALKLKEKYYLTADYYIEKLIIDPDELQVSDDDL